MPRDDALIPPPRTVTRAPGRPRDARRDGPLRLLLLAGTAEARQIASYLTREPRVTARAALARAERRPMPLGLPIRLGGWGGEEAFAHWLTEERIGALIDATHPFAVEMSRRAATVTERLGIDHIQFLRPAWRPGPGDDWTFLNAPEEAADHIPEGARVFIATGRATLARFAGLAGRDIFCRLLDTPGGDFPLPGGRFVQGRPPFSVADEIATFCRLGIDWLVVHNAGGAHSRTKLDAARELGLPVAMLRRPIQPEGVVRCETMSEVMGWVRRRL